MQVTVDKGLGLFSEAPVTSVPRVPVKAQASVCVSVISDDPGRRSPRHRPATTAAPLHHRSNKPLQL